MELGIAPKGFPPQLNWVKNSLPENFRPRRRVGSEFRSPPSV